jgi:hypothetical protein
MKNEGKVELSTCRAGPHILILVVHLVLDFLGGRVQGDLPILCCAPEGEFAQDHMIKHEFAFGHVILSIIADTFCRLSPEMAEPIGQQNRLGESCSRSHCVTTWLLSFAVEWCYYNWLHHSWWNVHPAQIHIRDLQAMIIIHNRH